MNLSSALVTELAPLVLLLRHASGFPVLVLEEPEAHLHPELQRRMAQVIVRLVRKGLFVWITTHSENFCQEINNFIKLGSLRPDKRAEAQHKLGYGSQDYLDLDDVSGCEFKLDETGERSTVVEMKRKEAGLVMPTFNKAIMSLSDAVFYLDDLLDQQEP
jgi:ABC-type multidrug transport system ATPase subunit